MSEVSELMARDPLKLIREDRTAIIAYFRENRIRFIQGNKAAGNPKELKPKAEKVSKAKADALPQLTLSLDDLEI